MVRRRKTCMKPELFNKVWLLHERWQLLSTIEKGTDNIARFLKNIWRRAILILTINKSRFPTIVLGTYGEVNPIAPASIPFYQQFVIVLSGLIRIIHHDPVCFHSTLSQNHKITKSQITKGKIKWKNTNGSNEITIINNNILYIL